MSWLISFVWSLSSCEEREVDSGGVVVKLLTCGARGSAFDSRSRRYDFRFGYLLLPSRDMAEISLKRWTLMLKTTNQPTGTRSKIELQNEKNLANSVIRTKPFRSQIRRDNVVQARLEKILHDHLDRGVQVFVSMYPLSKEIGRDIRDMRRIP